MKIFVKYSLIPLFLYPLADKSAELWKQRYLLWLDFTNRVSVLEGSLATSFSSPSEESSRGSRENLTLPVVHQDYLRATRNVGAVSNLISEL